MRILVFIIFIKLLLLTDFIKVDSFTPIVNPVVNLQNQVNIELNALEKEINKIRSDNGLNVLKASDCLRQRADLRLTEIQNKFEHYRLNGNFATSEQYCNATKKGENLSKDIFEAELLIPNWLNSPTHKKVILNPKYKYIGLEFKNGYAVMEVSN